MRDGVIGIDDVIFHRDGPIGFPVLRFTFEPCRQGDHGNCLAYIEDPGAGDRLDWQCDCDECDHDLTGLLLDQGADPGASAVASVKRATLFDGIIDSFQTEAELNGFRDSQGRLL